MPANGLRRLRGPSAHLLAVGGCIAAAVVLLYAAARFTSLFALQELEVTGGRPAVRAAARAAAEPLLGESLVALDQDELRRRLQAIPAVRSFHVDRAFPHTLRILVVQERPLAVVRSGRDAWLVSDRGRVLQGIDLETPARRPIVWAGPEWTFTPGATVQAENVRVALEALRRVPEGFPERVQSVRASDGDVTLVLAGGLELRLGRPDALALKLAVAARVLSGIRAEGAQALAYLDVSVPERPVGGSTLDSQVEGES